MSSFTPFGGLARCGLLFRLQIGFGPRVRHDTPDAHRPEGHSIGTRTSSLYQATQHKNNVPTLSGVLTPSSKEYSSPLSCLWEEYPTHLLGSQTPRYLFSPNQDQSLYQTFIAPNTYSSFTMENYIKTRKSLTYPSDNLSFFCKSLSEGRRHASAPYQPTGSAAPPLPQHHLATPTNDGVATAQWRGGDWDEWFSGSGGLLLWRGWDWVGLIRSCFLANYAFMKEA